MKLNKKEFVGKIAKMSSLSQADVLRVLESFQTVSLEILLSEKEVNLLDMGKLKISHRASRPGVNPKTKERITLPAKDVVRMAPSRKMKSFVAKEDSVTVKSFTY